MITLHSQIAATKGKPVVIDCPACGAHGALATPCESADWVKLVYLIPLLKIRSTWVECEQCRANIRCLAPLREIASADAKVMAPFLRYHPSSGAKALSIVGLLTCLIPVVGLVTVGIATFVGRGTKGWPAAVNVFSLIVSVAVTFSVLFLVFSSR